MATARNRKRHAADILVDREHPDRIRTGVGTPDAHAEAGGIALGGDAGDVGTPRHQQAGSPGGFGNGNTMSERE